MKNLKKVLALGLALVMMLGMFTVASAAETKKTAQEFPDWASVENKDAVSLMVDLGVINGKTDGTYAPAETIDRASWAKMVFFVLTGETNGDIYASDYPVLKDISKNWAQGFIEYLYSIDCISGDNLGNFNPSQPISVVAAAKTMLTGLGYNSKIEGYEGDANWATNIMNKAKSLGLLNGISLKQNDNISRDAAAQMVYNALSAQTVTAKYQLNFMTGERVPSGEYDKGETLGEKAFEIRKFETKVTGVNKGLAEFANIAIKGDVKASLSDMGKTVAVWCKYTATTTDGKTTYTAKEAVSTSVASAANTAFKTVTGGVDFTKCYTKANKDDFIAEAAEGGVTYFVNGAAGTTTAPTVKSGEVVEFYTNDDGKIDVVHIYTYKVGKIKADPTTKTKDDKTTVDLKLDGVTANISVDQVSGDWASLKKDDIVLFYTNGTSTDMVVNLELAEKITGKVTNKNNKNSKLTVNGTAYAESGIAATGDNAPGFSAWNVKDNEKNEYDFYLDKNGDVCWKVLIEGEVETKVAYVLDAAEVTAGGGGLNKADAYIEAKLLFTDATTEIVKVVKVGETATKDDKTIATTATNLKGHLIDYSVNSDGNYELKSKTEKTATGAVAVKPGFATGLTANNSTVFVVEKVDGDDSTFFTYTGYKNVPAMNAEDVSAISAVENKDGFVEYAYIKTAAFAGEGSDGLIYINDAADWGQGASSDVRTYYGVVNAKGEVVDVDIKTSTDLTSGKFYTIKSTTDGVAVVEEYTKTAAAALDSIGGGVAKTGNGANTYSYDDASVCVVIDKTDELAATTFDPSNFSMDTDSNTYTATVQANGDGVIEYIYVVVAAKA